MARFTLDTATEFLLGQSADSMSEPFLTPGGVSLASPMSDVPQSPAQKFAKAFGQGQAIVAMRIRMGEVWKLFEIRGDKVLPYMKVIDEYLDPILEDALGKARKSEIIEKGGEAIEEDTNFLEHMMTQTQGISITFTGIQS
jgi:hypothetical protein